jgi:hypothetical protein
MKISLSKVRWDFYATLLDMHLDISSKKEITDIGKSNRVNRVANLDLHHANRTNWMSTHAVLW